ncbi:MAG: glycosyltransferase [Prosthecobacter sp.]
MNRFLKSIHIWVPGITEGAGGIQAFSRVYVQAIRQAYPQTELRVFVKNDEPALDDPLWMMGVTFHSVVRYPPWLRTVMLVIRGLGLGLWERPACVVTTHLHFLPALCWLKWLRGVRVMTVLHGIEAWDLRGGPRVQALRRADHLLAVSRHTRQAVIDSYGIDPLKISVVPNTFDTARFELGPKPEHLLRRYGLRADQPVLLTVSRLALTERYKGHRQVLEALERVRRRFPDVCYLIVGTGDDMPSLREAVEAGGLQSNVILAGHVPGEELADHYRLCDAFVMPSSREGFGIVFLETMACGKPVVAGNVDGSVDALEGGRLGRLVNPNDPGQIAEAICETLAHEPKGALWHDPVALRAEVVAHFGYSRVSRLLADDLASLIGGDRLAWQRQTSETGSLRTRTGSGTATPRIVVLTQLTSPYQVEFFDALAASGDCRLEVIYLTSEDRSRQWVAPSITHEHVILSESPHRRGHAMQALRETELAVFNYYTDWFTLRAIRERASSGRPWVFWGERPGFLQTGLLGVLARWFLLEPLHRHAVPIWGVGRFGVEGYQQEFGHGRAYQNIPYFSNLERFFKIERAEESPRVFLYSGSLSHRKGVDLLAAAFARLATRFPQARLVVVGAGELEMHMRNVLGGCVDKVSWLGFRPWEELPKCYAQGCVFCFPSRYDGWGLALVEALSAGMPSIGTERTGAAVEFLGEGKAGWLVEAGSAQELEEAMEAALTMPQEDFARMQVAARAVVSQNGLKEGVQRFTSAAKDVMAQWRTASRQP